MENDAPVDAPVDDSALTAPGAEADPTPVEESGAATPEKDISFYEAELRRARDEAAESRIAARRFKEAFEGYEEPEVDRFLELSKALVTNPEMAYKEFKEIADRLEKEYGAKPDEEPKYLTAADLEQIEQQKAREALIGKVLSRSQELGYEEGTDAQAQLLWIASKDPATADLDDLAAIDKAHEIMTGRLEAYKAQVLAEYLAEVEAQAGKFPPVSSGGAGGVSPEPAGDPGDWGSARKAARERMQAAGIGRKK